MPASKDEAEIQMRIRIVIWGLIVAFICLATRLWYVQVAKGDFYRQQSENNRTRIIRARAPRGQILDRNGHLLASTRPQIAVSVIQSELIHPDEELDRLAVILHTTRQALEEQIKAHQITRYLPVQVTADVPIEIISQIKEQQVLLPGIQLDVNPIRFYPNGLGCHVLGYLSQATEDDLTFLKDYNYGLGDDVGKMGLEQELNIPLRGEDGGQLVEVDAAGRMTRFLGHKAPVPGDAVVLTIDQDVQRAAEQGLAGKSGSAVAVDPRNGEVLAMASSPGFDANAFARGLKPNEWAKIATDKRHPLQNRAISNKYPPGSTFKIITATAGLMCGAITDSTRAFCPGAYYLGHARFGCWGRHGTVDLVKAIAMSCDVFFYQAGQRMGPFRLAKMARAFGLDTRTGIALRGETSGNIPDPDWKRKWVKRDPVWHPGETIITAIGQGAVQASSLQMCMVAATAANRGTVYIPRLIKAIRDSRGNQLHSYSAVTPIRDARDHDTGKREIRVKTWDVQVKSKVPASKEALDKVCNALHQTVVSGTGKIVNIPGIDVAAKTGSAEDPPHPAHAWFVCFAPVDNPKIAICVMVEHGRHGGSAGGPIARKMLEAYFHLHSSTASAGKTD